MKFDTGTLSTVGRLLAAFCLLWMWFGVIMPYCINVTNTISMAVSIAFTIFVGGVLASWVVKRLLVRRKTPKGDKLS